MCVELGKGTLLHSAFAGFAYCHFLIALSLLSNPSLSTDLHNVELNFNFFLGPHKSATAE